MIKIINPGIYVSVQDKGRNGYFEMAMPPSGAMDEYSFIAANLLVGNEENAACLEVTYLGPTIEFQEDYTIAITGGEMPPKINGERIPMWQSVQVKTGDILSFDFITKGARTYIAISGGIDVPVVMGARSTYTSIGIGGYKGRPLKEGDVLESRIGNHDHVHKELPSSYIPNFKTDYEINVVLGMCSYRFTEDSIKDFFECEWKVTPEADRVGYRLKGIQLQFKEREQPFGAGSNPSNIVDSGYPIGSIQIPNGTEPIVLLRDGVTCGGFVTLGTVVSSDLNTMGQIKTGETIKFNQVSMEEALTIRKNYQSRVNQLKNYLLS